jgi:DNA repair exonuclease SbcCD ATPase subunit
MQTMPRNLSSLIFVVVLALLSPIAGRADDAAQATTESRLRDALRGSMQQLRDAQGQVAALQAGQAQSDKDNADLKTKIDALTAQMGSLNKQSADDRAASDKAIADLKSQNADLTTQMAKLNEALAAWEKDDKQYVQLAKDKESARAQLAVEVIMLQRVVDDRETKNLALFKLGNEILTRYEKFSLGDALGAKEPFTGISRVKLQELVQDYKDKVSDQRVTPGQAPATPPVIAAEPKAATNSALPAEKKAAAQAHPPVTTAQRM